MSKLIQAAARKNNIIGEAVLRPLKAGIIPIDEWQPEDADIIVRHSGKTAYVPFDEIFERSVEMSFNTFDLSYKEAYYKKLPNITHYINYFLKYYDPERELILAYLRLKWMIDSNEIKNLRRDSFIEWMNRVMFTDSICSKIAHLSKDNYRVDLEPNKHKKRKGNKKVFPAALQFNEKHAEILMRVSVAIKFAIPIVMHYIRTYKGKSEPKLNLYRYFMPLFSNHILVEDVNILGKLRHTIASRVNSFAKPDKGIYEKHEAMGSSTETFIEDLFHKNIITDTVFDYQFNGNIISYNSVVFRLQLTFHSKEDLRKNFHEVSTEKEPEGLSGLDKMEMYTTKIDSFLSIFSRVNIKDTMGRIRKRVKVAISPNEVQFYLNYHDFNVISKELIFYFFAKYFGGFRDLNFIKREDYVLLMIMMKRMLEAEGLGYLSQLASASIQGKSSARVIRNSKFLDKVMQSDIYQNLMEKKYPSLKCEKDSPVITLLSRIINTNWTVCDYDVTEHLGERLVIPDNDVLAAEFLKFVDSI